MCLGARYPENPPGRGKAGFPLLIIIGDIHGCRTEFEELLDKVGVSAGDEIIALGEIVDRGPELP